LAPFTKWRVKTLYWGANSLFQLKTTGASYYRDAIQKITNLEPGTNAFFLCNATLNPEDDNAHDSNAVKIIIEGHRVGFMPRACAVMYQSYFKEFNIPVQNATREALITKGYYSNECICNN